MNRFTRISLLVVALVSTTTTAKAQELPLGSALPMADQQITLSNGSQAALQSLAGNNGMVVAFWSNQCPWVDKYEERFQALHNDFAAQGIGFVLVNSNDPTAFPQESASESDKKAQALGIPYIMDQGAILATAFGASRAPHIYSFDNTRTLVYLGSIDDSPGDPASVQNSYLRDVLTALVAGSSSSVPQTKAFGCRLKTEG